MTATPLCVDKILSCSYFTAIQAWKIKSLLSRKHPLPFEDFSSELIATDSLSCYVKWPAQWLLTLLKVRLRVLCFFIAKFSRDDVRCFCPKAD